MKKISGLVLIVALIAGCGKTNTYSNDFSAATFINASPGTPGVNVLVDNANQTGNAVFYQAGSGYLNLRPGARNILLQPLGTNPVAPINYVSLPAENFVTNTATTYIIYDTLLTPTGTLRTLKLNDTLAVPTTGFIKIRYIPAAPNAPASDITFLRTTGVPVDSFTISNQTYVGPTPSAAAVTNLSMFIQIPAGNFIIKQKIAGTQTVIASTPPPGNPGAFVTTIGGIYKGIFTVYSTGTAKSQPLSLGFVRHYP